MSARIRAHDWAATPLGPIEAWPQSLKTVVGMMVAAPNPMALLWGQDGILVYNEGYARIAGPRHPAILGAAAAEAWPEVSDFNAENIRRGLAGEAWSLRRQSLPLNRNGSVEAAWWDLDYAPVRDEAGRPAGVIAFVTEVTAQVLIERRQEALIALDDAIGRTDDPLEMAEAAVAILGRTLGADRVGYGVIDPDREFIDVVRDWRATDSAASVVGPHNFRDYGLYVEDIVAGRIVTIDDVRTDPRTRDDPLPLLSYGVAALLDAPLQEGGRTVAQLLVHSATPRTWTAEEIAFTREFGERTRAAIARREAERDAARRRDELQRLTDSLTVLVSFVDRDHRYQLNNRAYADWFGPEAESLVGRPLVEVLGEAAYAKALPRIEAALAGQTLSFEDYLPYAGARGRHIRADYVPRRDATGAVDGFYAVVSDISERKEAELRQKALVEIGDAMRDLSDPAILAARAAEVLGRYLKADRVGYATVNTAAETIHVEQDWVSERARSIAGTLRLRDWGDFIDEMKTGATLRVEDVRGDPRAEGAVRSLEDAACRAFINVPILEGGDLVAMIFVNQADARVWSAIEVELVQQAAVRIRTQVERARATQALAENEARLRFLDGLFQATAELTDPDAILAVTTRMTAEHLGVSNCAYADMDEDQDGFTIRGDWAAAGSQSIVGHYRLRDFGARAVEDLGSGRALIVSDVEGELSQDDAAAFKAIGLAATLCMPLVKRGRLTALMAVQHREPRVWSANELSLIREVTERSWANIERVRSQAALSVSEDRYRRLFDIIDEGFCVIEFVDGPEGPLSDYVHIEANPAYTLNAGIPDIVGKRLREIVGDEADGWLALYKGVLETGRPIRFEKELEQTGRWLELAAFRVEDPGVNQVAVLFKDLTDKKRSEQALQTLNATLEERVAERTAELMHAEEALRQSQKMEAIGQLTGGIAHDFNNLLAGISGSLELIEKRMAEGRLAGMDRYIQAAQGASRRAATLTQRLLAFSRRQTLDPKPTDVNRLVLGMEDLIRRSVGPDVRVTLDTDPDLWTTRIDPSQLENALLNLCINSRDAMAPVGGDLTIRTYNVTLDATEARFRDLAPGDYVKMSVTDTGSGMTPDVIAKAFDPFFTTKPIGQGTGLGLSMIHGFMRQSGGQVRIESAPGQGTTITLALPRWMGAADAGEALAGETAAEEETGQGETVLVIDDEETVRMLVVEVLEDAGYSVLQAADGPAGLAILNSDARIDLLVSDVGLPGGMNGRQVADAARVRRPDLKVLFITGYAENAVVAGDTLEPGMAVMTKPFQVSALGARIREMIEG